MPIMLDILYVIEGVNVYEPKCLFLPIKLGKVFFRKIFIDVQIVGQ